jgi:nucleoside-diphosphate-sugar epimerase
MTGNRLSADLDKILDHTRGLWDVLRGERLFITGGTGFFGCWLLESFAWANTRLGLGASALVLTRDLERFRRKAPHLAQNPAVKFHIGDIRDFAFPPGSFSHLIHAATESSVKLNAEQPQVMLDTILEGTRRTLDFAAACGAKRFLLTSSGAVYGKQPPGMTHIPEDYPGAPDPLDPLSAYGEGKRLAELLCSLYSESTSLQVKIARGFAFVGPYLPLDAHFAVGNFIRDGLNGGPIVVQGDGTPLRSYLYAADLAAWLWTILFRGQSCRPYNVGSAEGISIRALAELVAVQFQPSPQVEVRGKADPQKPLEQYVPDVSNANTDLDLYPVIDLAEGLRKTIQFNCSGRNEE